MNNQNDDDMTKYFNIYEDYVDSSDSEVHSAVAIRYDREHDRAPVVVAKGNNILAKRMTELAKKHNIPIINDSSVLELMNVHVGSEIPYFMYEALSVILAYVYRLSRDK